jgi:predicted ATPase
LNLFQRLLRGAHRAALEWASPLKAVLQSERGRIAAELQAEGGPAVVLWLDRQKDLLRFAADYAQRVHDDVADVLEADRVFWQLCKSIRGAGQVERVAQLLLDWGRANGHRLHAHLKVSPQMMFPGWRPGAMERPSPPFLSVQRLRRLRSARWAIPRDLSLLIGPNGSGKTTLLRCLTFLHLALERSPGEAIQIAFGGAQNLRSRGAPDAEPVLIELALAEARWVWSIWPSGGGFNWTEEIFTGEQRCFHRDLSGAEVADGVRWRSTGRSGLWSLSYAGRAGPALEALARVVAGIRVHGDLDIEHLREVGADSALGAGELDRRGHQALALLQRWMDDPREEERHHFVVEGLKSAFPQDLSRFGRADGAGRYIQFQVFAPGAAQPTPLSDQASGFLQALLVLTALAAAEPGGIVLIDDPESCLHPFAERCLMAFARDWAAQRQLSIVLVTHSGVMLNGLTEAPERVFLAVPHPSTETIPCALTALFDEDWLHRFTLGERQADNSFGTNQAPP